MAASPVKTQSLLGRLIDVSLGAAFTTLDLADAGLTAAWQLNRRVMTAVEDAAEPLRGPLDAIGASELVRRPVQAVTVRLETTMVELETRGRTGLVQGDGVTAQTVTGIINSVLAYLKDNPDVRAFVVAQMDWLLPLLAQSPAVTALAREQVAAILPELATDSAIQQLIREQAGQYIEYLAQHPEIVQTLIRTQGDIYIDYLNAHPTTVQNLLQGQSLSLASQVRDEVRERSATADSLVDTIVRNVLRLRPREEMLPPPEAVQRRAELAHLPSDYVREGNDGKA